MVELKLPLVLLPPAPPELPELLQQGQELPPMLVLPVRPAVQLPKLLGLVELLAANLVVLPLLGLLRLPGLNGNPSPRWKLHSSCHLHPNRPVSRIP